MGIFLWVVWYIVTLIQLLLGYGTAYRYTKKGGRQRRLALRLVFVFSLAAMIPYLGIHLWKESKRDE